jgi:hypothetical protein
MAVVPHHLLEPGELGQPAGLGACHADFADFGIVADYCGAVCTETNIELEAVAPVAERKIEGFKRVLGDVGGGTRPAMAQKQGNSEHCAF